MSDNGSGRYSAYNRPAYKSRQPTSGDATPTSRSKLGREDSDNLLSYYQSPIADEGRNYARPLSPDKPHTRTVQKARKASSASSSSSSDYSDESEVHDARDVGSVSSSSMTRRSSTLSKGGADKRRIAIVEMDPVRERKSNSDISLNLNPVRSRRANGNTLTGLALVAPPDASLTSYTQFSPPTTAPVPGDYMSRNQLASDQDKGHHRSASENPADLDKAASRDAGSVGEGQGRRTKSPFLSANNGSTKNTKTEDKNTYASAPAHVFQHSTTSRSPSPTKISDLGDRGRKHLSPLDKTPMSARTMASQILTPAIGEGKEMHVPVAGPVVVKLDNLPPRTAPSAASWRSDSPTPSYGSASNHGSSYSAVSATSSYLRYEPGVHATAGPLPPPPRAVFSIDTTSPPPPRPPRLHSPTPPSTSARRRGDFEAVKQALQLPPSVNAVLNSKLSNQSLTESLSRLDKKRMEEKLEVTDKTEVKETTEANGKAEVQGMEAASGKEAKESSPALHHSKSIHRREGATLSTSTDSNTSDPSHAIAAPSSESSSVSSSEEKLSSAETTTVDSDDTPAVTVVAPPRSNTLPPETIDHSRFDKWLEENPQLTQPSDGHRSSSLDERRESLEPPLCPSPDNSIGEAPSPPPKSFRNSLTTNLKRFSALPRTPSLSSKSANRSSGSTRHSRTPSPSIPMFARPPFKKIKSTNPAALFCHEVHSQTTALQRCAIYTAKINEFYIHDCGLTEWVEERPPATTNAQRGPSTRTFAPQPRQTSRSSMISDATFPMRPDATVATDLSQGAYRDITPPGVPSLPYPSLAMNPPAHAKPTRSNSSVGSGTPTSSIRSLAPTPSLKGGFFASLGRKASISGPRNKFLPTISAPIPISMGLAGRAGSKHSHASMNFAPRSATAASPPSVPSGPRAPPNRAQRSQTFMTPVSPTSLNNDIARRPSLFNMTSEDVIDIRVDPEFVQQVDKLHSVIPRADRDVLARYLQRSGSDMLALGQYLEDERMGTIQRF